MKAPILWINDFTSVSGINVKILSDKMTLSGSKVEGIEITGDEISNVVTGKIIEISKHPDADKLVVCKIDIKEKMLQIVTGAKNVKVGDIVPVALDGATLAKDVKIETGKLRGVISEGMLCSIEEIGYTKEDFPDALEDGIYILPDDTKINQDILKVLGLGQAIIDFEITSNRPDCFSIEGLAREVAVTMDLTFTALNPKVIGTDGFSVNDLIKIENISPNLCKRYMARAVKNVKIAPSPDWMVSRLRDAGLRSINNIVDITNYVMIELGQPMHAFDYEDLHDKSITIRNATNGETIVTLDEISHILNDNMLVIADAHKPVAMAGIMGGENSQIKASTKTIIFESANFEGINVRLTAKKLGMRTESSSRFEKGLDVFNAKRAIDRACELIEILDCGEVSFDEIDIFPQIPKAIRIEFRPDKINSFLGTNISKEQMIEILEKLECKFENKEATIYCEVPSFRPDLEEEVDLAEEVARFYGYNNIEPTLLSGKSTTLGGLTPYQKQKVLLSEIMQANGFFEACTYSFMSPKMFENLCLPENDTLRNAITIMNPLGEDFSVMRTTMLGSLLEIASTNWNRDVDYVKIFEIAKIYIPDINKKDTLPTEKDTLGCVYYVKNDSFDKSESFYKVKGIAQEIIRKFKVSDVKFEPLTNSPSFHPGRSLRIVTGEIEIGVLGYPHPDVAQNMNAPYETVVLMIDIESLLLKATMKRVYSPLPKFPPMTRDLALIMDTKTPIGSIEEIIKEVGGKYLESVKLFDIYTGKQIADDKKSVAYQLVFRSSEGTLTDDIVNMSVNVLLEKLKDKFNAVLR